MPLPDENFSNFQVMIDPITGKVSLFCPSPIIVFDELQDFREFVLMLQSRIPSLEERHVGNKPMIEEGYAKHLLDEWQYEINKNFQKKKTRKKRRKKPPTEGDESTKKE